MIFLFRFEYVATRATCLSRRAQTSPCNKRLGLGFEHVPLRAFARALPSRPSCILELWSPRRLDLDSLSLQGPTDLLALNHDHLAQVLRNEHAASRGNGRHGHDGPGSPGGPNHRVVSEGFLGLKFSARLALANLKRLCSVLDKVTRGLWLAI